MKIKEVSRKTVERITNNGKRVSLLVVYVEKSSLSPAFGRAFFHRGVAFVRDDLSPRIKRHVENHEIYHLLDEKTWGSWWGRELRTLAIVPKDPLGFLATMWATFTTQERILFIIDRIKKGY